MPAIVNTGVVSPTIHEIVSNKQDPHAHREAQADDPGTVALIRRQALDQDRDEDHVVDAEDDLEHRQGQQGDPGLGVRQQVHALQGSGCDARHPAIGPQGDPRTEAATVMGSLFSDAAQVRRGPRRSVAAGEPDTMARP